MKKTVIAALLLFFCSGWNTRGQQSGGLKISVQGGEVVQSTAPRAQARPEENAKRSWSVCFTPPGGCTEAIIQAVSDANKSILVQAYSFTSAPIAKALLDAHKRGVVVTVILDKSQTSEHYSSADFFLHAGIATWIDGAHAIAHSKVMVIDGETVITGSFNFTRAAEERNAENVLIIHDSALAGKYTANWGAHLAHSDSYAKPDSQRSGNSGPRVSQGPAEVTESGEISGLAGSLKSESAEKQNLEQIVYVTETGRKYHRAGCRSLGKSHIPITLKDAIARGFTPCRICNPPLPKD